MSYQTGTASSTADFLDKLRVFTIANGWTIDKSDATPGSATLYVNRGGVYVSMGENAGQNLILVYPNTGFDDLSAISAQPGNENTLQFNDLAGSFTAYHFFTESTTSDYIHCVIERVPGEFRHLCFGLLVKSSTYTGGQYTGVDYRHQGTTIVRDSTSPNHSRPFNCHGTSGAGQTNIRADVEGQTHHWFRGPGGVVGKRMRGGYGHNNGLEGTRLMQNAPNAWNSLTTLIPFNMYLELKAGNSYWPCGYPKDIRGINLSNFSAGEQLSIGSDNWLLFPEYVQSNVQVAAIGVKNSWYYGLAYKKVV